MIFLRHLAWLPCREHLVEVLDQVDRLGVRVVVAAFAARESLAGYQHRQRLDHVQVLSDPDRRAYQTFGFGRGTLLRVWLHLRVWARYAQLVLRGHRPEPAHGDTAQLGGDALISADGRIAWIYRSSGPEDRPSLARIQAALTDLRAGAPAGQAATSAPRAGIDRLR